MATESANVPTALTTNTFTRTGYTFSSWNIAPNGSGVTYMNGATYSFTASTSLYAQWKPVPSPHAVRLIGRVVAGKVQNVIIVGSAFSGTNKVTSNAVGTRVSLLHVTSTHVTVRVTVRVGSRRGMDMFKITLKDGESCSIRYRTT